MSEQWINPNFELQYIQLTQKGGAFLTTANKGQVNTMTIGWATLGCVWSKPVLMVAVRPMRHTYSILEQALEFTVTIPKDDSLKEALAFCGTKSGRDHDKFAVCSLESIPAQAVATPVIATSAWQYECKVIYRQEMQTEGILLPQISERLYQPQHGKPHVLYFGEILAAYTI